MNDDKFRLPDVPAPPVVPGEAPGRTTLLRIGPKPDNLTKAETEVLTDEKRRLIEQIHSKLATLGRSGHRVAALRCDEAHLNYGLNDWQAPQVADWIRNSPTSTVP